MLYALQAIGGGSYQTRKLMRVIQERGKKRQSREPFLNPTVESIFKSAGRLGIIKQAEKGQTVFRDAFKNVTTNDLLVMEAVVKQACRREHGRAALHNLDEDTFNTVKKAVREIANIKQKRLDSVKTYSTEDLAKLKIVPFFAEDVRKDNSIVANLDEGTIAVIMVESYVRMPEMSRLESHNVKILEVFVHPEADKEYKQALKDRKALGVIDGIPVLIMDEVQKKYPCLARSLSVSI